MAISNGFKKEILAETEGVLQVISAPGVGIYYDAPEPGAFLVGGSAVGKLRILNKVYDLFLPLEVYGRVVSEDGKDHSMAVQYGQKLFRLNPGNTLEDAEAEAVESAGKAEEDLVAEGGFVVAAFTAGIFYAKPSPDSPPFVTEGQEIEKGKALGLIEVMKTFNHIVFHGTPTADRGTIKKILVKDSQEIKSGQPLFIVE